MKITPDTVVVVSRAQLSTRTPGGVVIAGLRAGNYFKLHSVGARVWELLQEPAAVGELQRIVTREYEVSEERARSDLYALLEQMAEQELIEVAHAIR